MRRVESQVPLPKSGQIGSDRGLQGRVVTLGSDLSTLQLHCGARRGSVLGRRGDGVHPRRA